MYILYTINKYLAKKSRQIFVFLRTFLLLLLLLFQFFFICNIRRASNRIYNKKGRRHSLLSLLFFFLIFLFFVYCVRLCAREQHNKQKANERSKYCHRYWCMTRIWYVCLTRDSNVVRLYLSVLFFWLISLGAVYSDSLTLYLDTLSCIQIWCNQSIGINYNYFWNKQLRQFCYTLFFSWQVRRGFCFEIMSV